MGSVVTGMGTGGSHFLLQPENLHGRSDQAGLVGVPVASRLNGVTAGFGVSVTIAGFGLGGVAAGLGVSVTTAGFGLGGVAAGLGLGGATAGFAVFGLGTVDEAPGLIAMNERPGLDARPAALFIELAGAPRRMGLLLVSRPAPLAIADSGRLVLGLLAAVVFVLQASSAASSSALSSSWRGSWAPAAPGLQHPGDGMVCSEAPEQGKLIALST